MSPVRSALIATAAVGLAACSGAAPAGDDGAATPVLTKVERPADLVGTWRVRAGDGRLLLSAYLELSHHQMKLTTPSCGGMRAYWEGDAAGNFVVLAQSTRPLCGGPDATVPHWLISAARFEAVGEQVRLIDRGGATVGVLTRHGRQPVDRRADQLPTALPPPTDLEPATMASLVGREWLPVYDSSLIARWPYVTFAEDRSFGGSDGCNDQHGRFSLGGDGLLVAVQGAQREAGCDNISIGEWLHSATRAVFDGDHLVLLNSAGREAGRLRPIEPIDDAISSATRVPAPEPGVTRGYASFTSALSLARLGLAG
ncbi:MAG: META domain-containing protein [Nocardioidaceae bacterium]